MYFQIYLSILLQNLKVFNFASAGHGCVWNTLKAPMKLIGMSGTFEYGNWTILHFVDRLRESTQRIYLMHRYSSQYT